MNHSQEPGNHWFFVGFQNWENISAESERNFLWKRNSGEYIFPSGLCTIRECSECVCVAPKHKSNPWQTRAETPSFGVIATRDFQIESFCWKHCHVLAVGSNRFPGFVGLVIDTRLYFVYGWAEAFRSAVGWFSKKLPFLGIFEQFQSSVGSFQRKQF